MSDNARDEDEGYDVQEPKKPTTEADPDVAHGRRAREMVDTDGHDGWIHAEILDSGPPESGPVGSEGP